MRSDHEIARAEAYEDDRAADPQARATEVAAEAIHNVPGVECDHIDGMKPTCESDAAHVAAALAEAGLLAARAASGAFYQRGMVDGARQSAGGAAVNESEFHDATSEYEWDENDRQQWWWPKVEALIAERDEWKRRRDSALDLCRFRHQEGLTAEEWHTKICGAMQGLQRERSRRYEAEDRLRGFQSMNWPEEAHRLQQQRNAALEDLRKAEDRLRAFENLVREWQFGGWTVLTEPLKTAEFPSLVAGQVVTNWLRERIERVFGR